MLANLDLDKREIEIIIHRRLRLLLRKLSMNSKLSIHLSWAIFNGCYVIGLVT